MGKMELNKEVKNMKKKLLLTATLIMTLLVGCGNQQVFDTTYTFNRAIIALPNGEVVEGRVDSWTDFEDGDQIQVKINGTTYLCHMENLTLISE